MTNLMAPIKSDDVLSITTELRLECVKTYHRWRLAHHCDYLCSNGKQPVTSCLLAFKRASIKDTRPSHSTQHAKYYC
jgi:hypothetical protein